MAGALRGKRFAKSGSYFAVPKTRRRPNWILFRLIGASDFALFVTVTISLTVPM